ncbi:GNAT family N-acetyltransferase [Chitinophaga filiformis]|uniref:GNAT family N-acetyltransferase n=1 Tax=Chitinophaga filiformis TaxID=104663 RepID=UPI001F22E06C|nr:GNAT family N-acetyltransferase [Chitinophaga filiformis]MCF6402868.1 GNAT family N-acetyltransferase [Chitinophaga filiformis]MCF6403214.1 GNAT family N-acetyltransferase [Chitinophaga filiformis]
MHNYAALDNPVWHALQTTHKAFAQGTERVQRYPADTLQFVGCADPLRADLNEILPWTAVGEKMIMIGELPVLPSNWTLLRQLDCIQMICDEPTSVASPDVVQLDNVEEMLALVNLVQPGFFYKHTPLLGTYYGIYQEGQLVAIAGERTKITGLVEVSAVCTHPEFTGRGYAQQLVAHIVNKQVAEGNALYLHFLTNNERARKVYERLGFRDRRPIVFWEIVRNT